MKKIIILLFSVLTLLTCSGCEQKIKTNDVDVPLIVHYGVKDNLECILVDQYTLVNEFNVEDYIYVDINKDVDYEIHWIGERLVSDTYKSYDDVLKTKINRSAAYNNLEDYVIDENAIEDSKRLTLNCEGFRPIQVFIDVHDGDNTISKVFELNLLIVPEDLADIIYGANSNSIEEIRQKLATSEYKDTYWLRHNVIDDVYYTSGLRNYEENG